MSRHDYMIGRRDVLRVGGLGVATAAVLSACGAETGEVGRVGSVSTTVPLPDAVVTNVTLLRTASSMEHSVINVYSQVVGNSDLLDPTHDATFQRFIDDHAAAAEAFEQATSDAGGTPWTCGNPKFDDVVVQPVLDRIIKGVPATSVAPAIPAERRPAPRHPQLRPRARGDADCDMSVVRGVVLRPGIARRFDEGRRERIAARCTAGLDDQPGSPGRMGQLQRCRQRRARLASDDDHRPEHHVAEHRQCSGCCRPLRHDRAVPQTEIPTVTAVPSQFGSLAAEPDRGRCRRRERNSPQGQPRDTEPQLVRLRVHATDLLSRSYTAADGESAG